MVTLVPNTPQERIRILQELGYELLDSDLWEGFLVLEESSAEHIIKEFLIPEFCPKIKDKIRTIAANGAGDVPARFTQLHRLFTYIHTTPVYKDKAWVILDGDKAGQMAIEELRSEKGFGKTWPAWHFVTFNEHEFESYYPQKYKNQINAIHEQKNKRTKGILKVNLAKTIVSEYTLNPKEMSKLFKESAAEVIDKLTSIQSHFRK